MRTFLITVSLPLLCVVGVCAESQSRSNQQQTIFPPAHTNIKNNPTYGRYTTGKPTPAQEIKPVAGLVTPDNKKEKENGFSEFFNVKFTDVIVALFTIIIGIYTYKLSDSTKKLWATTEESAKALPMIERAYIFATVRMEEWKIVVDLKNHGKTPAILKSMFVTRKFHPTPPKEIDTRQKSMIRDGVVIGSDIVWPVALSPWLDDSERQMLDRPDFKLFCFGVIEYLDVLNQRRTTGFCWQYNYQYGVGEWSIADSELNYYDRDENYNKSHISPKV